MRLHKNIVLLNAQNKVTLFILIVFVSTFFTLRTIKPKISEVLKIYAESEITTISTYIINEAINESVIKNLETENLMEIITNKNEEIISVNFNTTYINKTLVVINKSILNNLKKIENGEFSSIDSSIFKKEKSRNGFIYYIPLGVVSDNPAVADLGPKIPIKTTLVGAVTSDIKTELKEYGINNSLMKVYVEVSANLKFVMPFVTDDLKIKEEIPIVIKIINGSIPEVYGGSYAVTSPLNETL